MKKTVPAATARTQFGQLLDLVQSSRTRFVVSKNGAPAAVILGIEDYLEHVVKNPSALANLQAEARKRGLDLLSMAEIDAEVDDVRKKAHKRRRA